MSTPLYDEAQKMALAIFDSFSKTAMRNACRSYLSAKRKRKQKEVVGSGAVQYVIDTHGETDIYPSEHIITDGHGHSCVITTEWLYQAMLQLTEQQKEVLILEFWYGMMICSIAEMLHITERTVYNRKQSAFRSIRKYYKENR